MTSLLERLMTRLEAGRRSRVPLATLQDLVLELEPALRTSPLKRDRLAEALEEGVRGGRLRMPAQRRLYAGHPPLPSWVDVVRETEAAATVSGQEYFWRPELAWAAELRFRPDELERLKRVNAWLRDLEPDEPVIPVRERSLGAVRRREAAGAAAGRPAVLRRRAEPGAPARTDRPPALRVPPDL